MRVDVHGLLVHQAKEHVIKQITYALKSRDYVIEVNHGFNHGNAIKRQILSLNSEDHPAIIRVRSHILNPGVSIIDLKINLD